MRPERLFILQELGAIWVSEDQGSSFTRSSELQRLGATSIHFAPNRPGTLYGGSPGGILLSQDDGATWTIQRTGLGVAPIDFLVPHPHQAETVYAGNSSELMRSDNRGQTWQRLRVTRAEARQFALAIDPNSPDHLLLATERWLLESFDGGAKWARASDEPHRFVFDVVFDPRTLGAAWALTLESLFLITDSSPSWSRIDLPGNPRPQIGDQILVDPSSGTISLLLGQKTLLSSSDGGQTWTTLAPPLEADEQIGALVIDPYRDSNLYLGTSNAESDTAKTNRVLWSGDGGNSWANLAAGLPAGSQILSLAVDAGTGALYAGTASSRSGRGGEVYRLPLGNDRWRRIGHLAAPVNTLHIERRGRATVWVGTDNRGVLRLERRH